MVSGRFEYTGLLAYYPPRPAANRLMSVDHKTVSALIRWAHGLTANHFHSRAGHTYFGNTVSTRNNYTSSQGPLDLEARQLDGRYNHLHTERETRTKAQTAGWHSIDDFWKNGAHPAAGQVTFWEVVGEAEVSGLEAHHLASSDHLTNNKVHGFRSCC